MAKQREIVRYPGNRRYRVIGSKGYTTLREIREWILAGDSVRIIDYKTRVNITQAVLLDILCTTAWEGNVNVPASEFLMSQIRYSAVEAA